MKISLPPFAPDNLVSRDSSAVPPRVSLLILHTQPETGATAHGFFPLFATASNFIPSTAIAPVPEFIGSRTCVSVAFTDKSPPSQGQ